MIGYIGAIMMISAVVVPVGVVIIGKLMMKGK